MENEPDEYDQFDARWLELAKQLKEAGAGYERGQRYHILELGSYSLIIYFFENKKPLYEIYNFFEDLGRMKKVKTFQELFESSEDKYKEIFIFYLDLFSESNKL